MDFDRSCKRHIPETKASLLPAFMPLLQSTGVPRRCKEKITRSAFLPLVVVFFPQHCKTLLFQPPHSPCSTHAQPFFLGLLKFCSLKEIPGVESTSKQLNLVKTRAPERGSAQDPLIVECSSSPSFSKLGPRGVRSGQLHSRCRITSRRLGMQRACGAAGFCCCGRGLGFLRGKRV